MSSKFQELIQQLKKISSYTPDLESLCDRLEGNLEDIKDASMEIEAIGSSITYNEERIEELQSKLDDLYRVQQKHQTSTIEELVGIRDGLGVKLKSHSDMTVEILALKKKLEKNNKGLISLAKDISNKRKSVAPKLKASVESMLNKLAMEHARLNIEIETGDQLTPFGLDKVNFLFSPNKGSQFSTIKDIASGGELSRLALCIKANVASALTLPTMIFDELDTGISGEVAMKMGDIMSDLSQEHQIVAITHSPLIAAKANLHYSVYKSVEGERTITRIRSLDNHQRVEEIAKMLGGDPPGENAVKNAKDLLKV